MKWTMLDSKLEALDDPAPEVDRLMANIAEPSAMITRNIFSETHTKLTE